MEMQINLLIKPLMHRQISFYSKTPSPLAGEGGDEGELLAELLPLTSVLSPKGRGS